MSKIEVTLTYPKFQVSSRDFGILGICEACGFIEKS